MITTLLATFVLGLAPQQQKLHITCAVTGEDMEKAGATVLYRGSAYDMCCAGCANPFVKNPQKFLKEDRVKGRTVGVHLFDPVSGYAVKAERAKAGPVVHNGVAYYFTSAENKSAFEGNPKKFTAAPAKEALYCPVMKEPVAKITDSGGYADVNGVRYYICCPGCLGTFKADTKKYTGGDTTKHIKSVQTAKA